jgi:hypothetical protein
MKSALCLTAAVALILAAGINSSAAQTSSQPAPGATTNDLLKLSEQGKVVVIKAAVESKTHQKTPKDFTPAVGASVPKSVFMHAFKPTVGLKLPALKHYWYAYLDREIVLIDAMQKKVVAVIPLPAEYAFSGRQVHQGAAEPAGESRGEDGRSSTRGEDGRRSTNSVPAYTSPETIK